MDRLTEQDRAEALAKLARNRDDAIEQVVVEGYRMLTIARWASRWTDSAIPEDLLVERQIEEIATAIGASSDATTRRVRELAAAKFAELENAYEQLA